MHFELIKESFAQLEATTKHINHLNKRLFGLKFKSNDELTKINVRFKRNLKFKV